jgi:hypothetical protein
MTRSLTREKIYAGDYGYSIIIDMQRSVADATDISFFVRNTEGEATEITANITIHQKNSFKWVVPEKTTDVAGTYYIRPHFTQSAWTGSGKTVSFDVEDVSDTTPDP